MSLLIRIKFTAVLKVFMNSIINYIEGFCSLCAACNTVVDINESLFNKTEVVEYLPSQRRHGLERRGRQKALKKKFTPYI